MLSLPIILNTLIIGTITFFVSVLLFLSLKINNILSIILAVILSLSIGIIIMLITKRVENVRVNKNKQNTNIANLQKALNLTNSKDILTIIGEFFNKIQIEFTVKDNYFLLNNDVIFLPLFLPTFNFNDLSTQIKSLPTHKKLFIVADNFDKQVLLLKDDYVFIDSKAIIKEMIKYDIALPKHNKQKIDFTFLFSKQIGKKAIAYGILLLVMSLFVFYPIYYIIFGSIFIVYGITTQFFANSSPQKKGLNDLLSLSKDKEKQPS